MTDNNVTRSHLLRKGKIKKAVFDVLTKGEVVHIVFEAIKSSAGNLLLVVEECMRKGNAPFLFVIQVDSGPLMDLFDGTYEGMIWLLAERGNGPKEMIFKTIFGAKRENYNMLLGRTPRNFSSGCSIKLGELYCPRHHHQYLNAYHPHSAMLADPYPCPGCPTCPFECHVCRQANFAV